jgi:uncharacterized protein with HEPN domain
MHKLLAEIATLIEGQTRDAFMADTAKPHALAMYFLRLGEAANRTSRNTWGDHPQIPWQKLANLRHLIAHEYRRIDHLELWKLAIVDAPMLALDLPKPPAPKDIF